MCRSLTTFVLCGLQGKASSYVQRLVNYGLTSSMWHLIVPIAFAIGMVEAMTYLFGVSVLAGFIAGACCLPLCRALRWDAVDHTVCWTVQARSCLGW